MPQGTGAVSTQLLPRQCQYLTTSWDHDTLVQPEVRAAYAKLATQGWADCLRVQAAVWVVLEGGSAAAH